MIYTYELTSFVFQNDKCVPGAIRFNPRTAEGYTPQKSRNEEIRKTVWSHMKKKNLPINSEVPKLMSCNETKIFGLQDTKAKKLFSFGT